jgi:hypothetical protein
MMLKRLLSLFLIMTILPLPSGMAGFDDNGAGARGPGMANVQTAIADDANAIHYNPGGLPQLEDGEITTQYGQLLNGAGDGSSNTSTYIGYVHPLRNIKRAVIGFSYDQFKASSLFTERTIALSYGQHLRAPLFNLKGLWSAGFNIKQLHRQYQPDRFTENSLNDVGTGSGEADPLFARNGYAKDGYALDLGALYRFGPSNKYRLGGGFTNVNRPDMSLGGDGDKAPMGTKIGASVLSRFGLGSIEIRRTNRLESQVDTDIAVGGERKFNMESANFVIRGGYAQGSRDYKEFTAGMSYEMARTRLDYSFTMPMGNLSSSSNTSYRFGLSFKLANPDAAKKSTSKRRAEVDPHL